MVAERIQTERSELIRLSTGILDTLPETVRHKVAELILKHPNVQHVGAESKTKIGPDLEFDKPSGLRMLVTLNNAYRTVCEYREGNDWLAKQGVDLDTSLPFTMPELQKVIADRGIESFVDPLQDLNKMMAENPGLTRRSIIAWLHTFDLLTTEGFRSLDEAEQGGWNDQLASIAACKMLTADIVRALISNQIKNPETGVIVDIIPEQNS